MKKIPFTKAPKRIKYIGINLTKEVQTYSVKTKKKLPKEVKENLNKWENIPNS